MGEKRIRGSGEGPNSPEVVHHGAGGGKRKSAVTVRSGAGLGSLWQEALTLVGFAVTLMVISTMRFRQRLS